MQCREDVESLVPALLPWLAKLDTASTCQKANLCGPEAAAVEVFAAVRVIVCGSAQTRTWQGWLHGSFHLHILDWQFDVLVILLLNPRSWHAFCSPLSCLNAVWRQPMSSLSYVHKEACRAQVQGWPLISVHKQARYGQLPLKNHE